MDQAWTSQPGSQPGGCGSGGAASCLMPAVLVGTLRLRALHSTPAPMLGCDSPARSPRLQTARQGHIDWDGLGIDIDRQGAAAGSRRAASVSLPSPPPVFTPPNTLCRRWSRLGPWSRVRAPAATCEAALGCLCCLQGAKECSSGQHQWEGGTRVAAAEHWPAVATQRAPKPAHQPSGAGVSSCCPTGLPHMWGPLVPAPAVPPCALPA